MTEESILISAAGVKTHSSDMKKLQELLETRILPIAEKALNADFKTEYFKDYEEIKRECDHKFGIVDADLGFDYVDLYKANAIPMNPIIQCVLCEETWSLFTRAELSDDMIEKNLKIEDG